MPADRGNWVIVVYRGDGYESVRRERLNTTYGYVRNECVTYPPGWIWHIEPLKGEDE